MVQELFRTAGRGLPGGGQQGVEVSFPGGVGPDGDVALVAGKVVLVKGFHHCPHVRRILHVANNPCGGIPASTAPACMLLTSIRSCVPAGIRDGRLRFGQFSAGFAAREWSDLSPAGKDKPHPARRLSASGPTSYFGAGAFWLKAGWNSNSRGNMRIWNNFIIQLSVL